MHRIAVLFEVTKPHYPSKATLRHWIAHTLDAEKPNSACELQLLIANEDTMTTLNTHYRGKSQPTNVLSFAYSLSPAIAGNQLGDMAICPSIVEQEAMQQNKPFLAHFAHMAVHGTLHLLGHDHEEPEETARMEAMEQRLLQEMGFPNPYEAIE